MNARIALLAFVALSGSARATQVYVGNFADGDIQRFSTTGVFLGTFANSGSAAGPIALAWAQNNQLFVGDYNTSQVVRYSESGAYLGVFAATVSNPKDLMFDNSGNLWVSTLYGPGNSADIQEFNSSGGLIQTISTGLTRVDQMALAPNGNIYVADFIDSQIHVFSPAGADLGVFADFASTGITSEGSLAINKNGDVFTGNTFTSTFYKLNASGNTVASWTNPGVPGHAGGALEDFTVGPGNVLYAVDSFSNNVWAFDAAGNSLGQFIGSNLNQPYQMAFGPNAASTPSPAAMAPFMLGFAATRRRRLRLKQPWIRRPS